MLTRKTAIALLIMMNLQFVCASCAAVPDGGASGEPQEPAAEETAGDETTDPLALAP